MIHEQYFDMRNLAPPKDYLGGCPVSGCTASLGKVDSPRRDKTNGQWRQMPYCPEHRIRIHHASMKSRTFAYYNGPGEALQNILFERNYFKKHILGNKAKAETSRFCYENSEDALTWNVFSSLAKGGLLAKLLSDLTHLDIKDEPELYLWGIRIHLDDSSSQAKVTELLDDAREFFEEGIVRFRTEPDIMLYAPNQVLLLIEAKFTSGNTIALADVIHENTDEKPKSREGILRRYKLPEHLSDRLLSPPQSGPFYSQLYRNLVFAIYMADKLGVDWSLANLVSDGQFHQREYKVEYQNPTQFIHSFLPEKSHDPFQFYSWERLYADHVANDNKLNVLAEYIKNKSANCAQAF